MKNAVNGKLAGSAFILAMAVVTSVSWGQVQRVQVGRALDANPLVGSGGSNQPISGYVPGQANGNDIISGNVAGLKYFHGNLHELTPYTFGAHLGSADLDAFARQTAGGIPTSYGAQPFFLPSTVVSTGQGSLYSAPAGSGFDSRIIPQSSVSPLSGQVNGAWIGGSIPVRTFGESEPITNNGVMAPGRAIQSPLFSLRPGSEPRTGTPTIGDTGPDQNLPVTPTGPNTEQMQEQLQRQIKPESPDNTQDNTQNGTDQTTGQASSNGLPRINRPLNEQARVAIGESQRVTGQPMDMRNQAIGPQELASNQGSQQVSDVYKQLSDNLDRAAGIEKPAGEQTDMTGTSGQMPRKVAGVNLKNGNENLASANGVKPERETGSFITPEKKVGADNGLTNGGAGTDLNNPGGLGKTDNGMETGTGGIRYQSTDPSLPGYRPRSGVVMDRGEEIQKQPDRVLRAGQKVEPLKSLAVQVAGGEKLTSFDTMMKQGEALMKEGKYLAAADEYQAALAMQPEDQLALLGRGNAELAAGMFQSAAYDLKLVFANKPTMIGVRYALQDYVPISRQDVLIKDLSDMTTAEETGNLGSFLLCYLYYNTDRRTQLYAELGRWKNRPWKDSWEAVAEKAWGK